MKTKARNGRSIGFAIRLTVSCLIVATALIMKVATSNFGDKISAFVNGTFDYKQAVSVIGGQFNEEDAVLVSGDQNIENDESAIEALSFQMSDEELHDDTKAEPFKIPPPSYCSYDKLEINFEYTTPLSGVVTSKYGYRDHPIIDNAGFHTGIDIGGKQGSAVCSFADGTVVEASYNDTYGNYLLIEHKNGIRSFYGHNSKLNVKSGSKVKMGQKIAEVGTTGLSTGPHLHFEIRNGTTRLDPAYYIKP